MQLHNGALILVCDAGKALVLENQGDQDLMDLRVLDTFEQDNPPTREQGTDRPGRYATPTGGRTATEETDWHDEAEARFAEALAAHLDGRLAGTNPAELVIIADPRTLGRLRPHLSGRVQAALTAEIAKDYVKHPVSDIEALIKGS